MSVARMFTATRLDPGREVVLDSEAGHYLFRVLRLRRGDSVVLFNGDGSDYVGELLSDRRDRVQVRVTARLPAVPESALIIELVQAIARGDRMDYSLQKAVELGVAAVQPLFTERTEVRLEKKRLATRMKHWYRVMTAACEQCGRAVIPDLQVPASLSEWLARDRGGQQLVLVPGSARSLAATPVENDCIQIVVGPEGGFSDLELKQMRLAGIRDVGLGPRVLRTETAGPAAIAVLQALYGDLN